MRILTLLCLAALAGCTGTHYSLTCGDKKLTVDAEGGLFTRSVDDIDLAVDKCGTSHVAGAKTDAVQAFKEGVKAGKEIAAAALAGPAGAAAVQVAK